MAKLTYLVLGILVLSGTAWMVGATPHGARGTSTPKEDTMDIRALEAATDLSRLPKGDLDPKIYE